MDEATLRTPLVDHLGPATLRRAVQERYQAVASDPQGHYNFRVGRAYAEALGYPHALLDSLPEETVNRFTGVSTPVLSAHLAPGECVLDLGCGAGLDTAVAAAAVGESGQVVALDFALAMARQTAHAAQTLGYKQVQVCQASAEALPLASGTMDCVLVNGLFNLVPEKRAVFKEVARVLRPGGRLIAAETVLTKSLPDGEVTSLDDWFR
jgi:SAM-dependent methyltransferase